MKNSKTESTQRSSRHPYGKEEPHRVASRLEGVIKNLGIKPKKKVSKSKK